MDRSPVVWGFWAFDHVNAIHWTGVDTEIATGTIIDDHRMHEFSGTDNGIDRACLNALGAANAFFLNDECYQILISSSCVGIKGERFHTQQRGNSIDSGLATWWATIDGFSMCNGLCVGFAPRMSTLATLCLWE
jgi:hypothetical protein